MTSFQTLFEEHAAASLDKQWALSDVIGDADWAADLDAGTISFGPKLTFPVQVLGSESEHSNTWLWVWANKQSDLPRKVLRAVQQLRDQGTRGHIPEFTNASLDLEQVTGHQLALVAAGVCRADCYYRGPYEGGAVFLLIEAPIVRQRADASPLRIINVFNQLISTFPLNHRRALLAYLRYKGYTMNETASGIEATGPGGAVLRATFDHLGRMVELDSVVGTKET